MKMSKYFKESILVALADTKMAKELISALEATGGSGGAWGSITGTLTNQIDLKNIIDDITTNADSIRGLLFNNNNLLFNAGDQVITDANTVYSVDFFHRVLFSSNSASSILWEDRQLSDGQIGMVADWSRGFKAQPVSTSGRRTDLNSNHAGVQCFDTTLGQPIWWNGSGWVNALGSSV